MKLQGFVVFAAVSVAFATVTGCNHSQKVSQDSPVERGVASAEAPNDYEADRHHFDGSANSVTKELRLMRGNLERSKALEISSDRERMLNYNLYDTGVDNLALDCASKMALGRTDYVLHHRTSDGTCYMHNQAKFMTAATESDLSGLKAMGAAGQRFGRNSAPPTAEEAAAHEKSLYEPNPVTISKKFFSRIPELAPETNGFQPVPWVNLLATAWLQAENHDWFSHGKNVDMSHLAKLPPEQQARYAQAFQPIQLDGFTIPRSMPDLSALRGENPGKKYARNGAATPGESAGRQYGRKYRNAVTHWWDASHIYGSDQATVTKVRTIPSGLPNEGTLYPDGKIAVDEKLKKLYYRPDPKNDGEILPITGFNDNWWLGLEMIHTIFALEHNKVAAALKVEFEKFNVLGDASHKYYQTIKNDPAKRSDFLYNKARLVVSALIAKIHTVEWTPALLDNPGLRLGMYANWHGLKTAVGDIESPPARRWLETLFGSKARMLASGLTGAGTLNFYKVPFTLTEEFVSVYRMHPLLSDDIKVLRPNGSSNRAEAVVEIDSARDGDVEKIFTET
ncbi:MAG: peroxidase family protein, partial [Bdellovibrionota bacterium]